MNKEEIKKIIPHREPMLLIDYADAVDENNGTGKYTVRGDEFFLQGHFPNNPVVPGVILCEMMAQACSVMLKEKIKGMTPFFTGINNVKMRAPVIPGDTFDIKCTLDKEKPPFYFVKADGYVNEKKVISGEFSLALK